jgi:hypothetical protein
MKPLNKSHNWELRVEKSNIECDLKSFLGNHNCSKSSDLETADKVRYMMMKERVSAIETKFKKDNYK